MWPLVKDLDTMSRGGERHRGGEMQAAGFGTSPPLARAGAL
jgi:hypothetical protein